MTDKPTPGADIQLFYARLIDWAAKCGFVLLLITFAVYITGIIRPYVPLEQLPHYWDKPAPHYLAAAGIQPGWGWVRELRHGDFLNFAPIAMLAGVSVAGYLALMVKFCRNREYILVMIVILQIMVLTLAASGILKTGGH